MAKQLTIRGVDKALARRLDLEARTRGLSVNRTVLALLRQALGMLPGDDGKPRKYRDLGHLAGTWSKEEADAFDQALREMRQIEDELWK